jgi:two-component system sensor histidine kinase/response regulator
MSTYVEDRSVAEVLEENGLLREEVRVARRASDIAAELVVEQFVRLEEMLRRLEDKNSTEQRLRQELEAKNAELDRTAAVAMEATRMKSAFLANMSHEIRTPMNAIMGMTDLALDTELTAEQREYLTMVKSSAESLLTLLNDILDFSRIEAGKLELDRIDFELRDGIGDTMRTLAVRAHSKGIELAYEVQPDVPDAVSGDINRLRQILVNLVSNAIKFTQAGEVVVRVGVESRAEDHVVLHTAVSDTGVGIPPEKLEAIFSPFEQVDTSTTRRFGGTGLGLAISSQLVELMQGRMRVESEVGKGSTFHFTVRFGLGKPTSKQRRYAELSELRELRTLVVDDNQTNRRILEQILGNWEMSPTSVPGGLEALRALDQAANAGNAFALIVSDVNMPEMDGFDLAERLRENPLHCGTPIILLTSASRAGDSERCRALGVAAQLLKPVKQSALLDAIVAAVARPERVAERTRRQKAAAADGVRGGRKLHILLAEDNAVNQKFAVRTLTKRGHSVIVANDGKEALAAWEREPFDVILMDVQMPEMDGFQATARIRDREKAAGSHIPIIAMTAHAMKGDRERCLEAGMDGYVMKPIQASTMFAEIERLVPDSTTGRADPPQEEPNG